MNGEETADLTALCRELEQQKQGSVLDAVRKIDEKLQIITETSFHDSAIRFSAAMHIYRLNAKDPKTVRLAAEVARGHWVNGNDPSFDAYVAMCIAGEIAPEEFYRRQSLL